MDVNAMEVALADVILSYDSALVAYSGGVDSSVVGYFALKYLGPDRVRCILADSPSLSREDRDQAVTTAQLLQLPLDIIETDELNKEQYRENSPQRCYVCKSTLFDAMQSLKEKEGYAILLDGFNLDDTKDFRPGFRAGMERNVCSPLRLAGLTKLDVRNLARYYQLPNWDKPSSPCLSSRIPYHTLVTESVLGQVERAERGLHELGFRNVRVRHHHPVARIEIPDGDMEKCLQMRLLIVEAVKSAGYLYVSLDLSGFRTGSLNETVYQKSSNEE